jgi:hypothetical protein
MMDTTRSVPKNARNAPQELEDQSLMDQSWLRLMLYVWNVLRNSNAKAALKTLMNVLVVLLEIIWSLQAWAKYLSQAAAPIVVLSELITSYQVFLKYLFANPVIGIASNVS